MLHSQILGISKKLSLFSASIQSYSRCWWSPKFWDPDTNPHSAMMTIGFWRGQSVLLHVSLLERIGALAFAYHWTLISLIAPSVLKPVWARLSQASSGLSTSSTLAKARQSWKASTSLFQAPSNPWGPQRLLRVSLDLRCDGFLATPVNERPQAGMGPFQVSLCSSRHLVTLRLKVNPWWTGPRYCRA